MKYTIHNYKDFYPKISGMDIIDFPQHEMLFNGVRTNGGYQYVSSSYLNGLINYAKILKVFLTFEYAYECKEDTLKKIKNVSDNEWHHANLGQFGDSVVVIGETDDSYITFIYDADVSDCDIFRYDKNDHTFDEVLNDTLSIMKDRQEYENAKCNEYVELQIPTGWIKY